MNISGVSPETLKHLRFVHVDDSMRAYVTQEGLDAIADRDALCRRLKSARDEARVDALKNLGRYKFANFGYYAARWVTLNAILGDKQPNPFKQLVDLARQIGGR